MILISACVCLINGLVATDYIFSEGWLVSSVSISVSVCASVLLVVMFGFIGFGFGVASGVNILRKKQYALCIIGSVVIIIQGVLNFLVLYLNVPIGIHYAIFLGSPIVVVSAIGLVLVYTQRKEFQDVT